MQKGKEQKSFKILFLALFSFWRKSSKWLLRHNGPPEFKVYIGLQIKIRKITFFSWFPWKVLFVLNGSSDLEGNLYDFTCLQVSGAQQQMYSAYTWTYFFFLDSSACKFRLVSERQSEFFSSQTSKAVIKIWQQIAVPRTFICPYSLLLSCSEATIRKQFSRMFCWWSTERNRIHLPVHWVELVLHKHQMWAQAAKSIFCFYFFNSIKGKCRKKALNVRNCFKHDELPQFILGSQFYLFEM